MSHLPFAIIAYLLNAVSVTVDKFLLTKHIENPLVYVFYFSLISLVALVLLPFAQMPTPQVFLLASTSTLLWTLGAYFMFLALQKGLVSRVIPIIGTLTPLILLLQASITGSVSHNEIGGVAFLIIGLIFITAGDWKGKLKAQEFLFELLSAVFFAISYTILREAYVQGNFFTVFVWARPVLIPVGLMLLAVPKTRHIILSKRDSGEGKKVNFLSWEFIKSKTARFFLVGQMAAAASELLLTFSVYLANPALVNSIQGVQYVFLFLLSLFLAKKFPQIYKERLSKLSLIGKILGILFIGGGLFVLAFAKTDNKQFEMGVTFSPRYAVELGIDPKKTYLEALNELQIKNLRMPIYWDDVESEKDKFDFSKEDFYLEEAQKRGVEVILVVGLKQPRWPECFVPNWAERLTPQDRSQRVLVLVQKELEHFKKYPNIKAWQVENEPFLWFGNCDAPVEREKILPQEIAIVKGLDPRPILITDSGELTTWRKSIPQAEWFGTTLYRSVWSPFFGSIDYPLPPFFYTAKRNIVQFLTGTKLEKSIVVELQAEPWATARAHITEVPLDEQAKLLPPKKILVNVSYAKETGFDEIYLWGVEWWYWMKEKGRPEYVEVAKQVFSQNK